MFQYQHLHTSILETGKGVSITLVVGQSDSWSNERKGTMYCFKKLISGRVIWAPVSSSCAVVPLPVRTPTTNAAFPFRPIPQSALVSPTTTHSSGLTFACLHKVNNGCGDGLLSITSSPQIEN
jgi:hypothetical protein